MEKHTVFMDWKNQNCQNDYTTQSNLYQCNPYQATNGIFHRTRTNNCTVCMETQKTWNSQSDIEKKWEESTCLTSDYTTKLQSLRQYGTGIKAEI